MIVLPGSATGSVITNGSSFPFPTATNPVISPGNTHITVPSTGTIKIASTGIYQITFGCQLTSNQGVDIIQLRINGNAPPVQQILEGTGGSGTLGSLTTIVSIPTNPSNLTMVNNSGGNVTANNASGTATGQPAAYVTIVKLQ